MIKKYKNTSVLYPGSKENASLGRSWNTLLTIVGNMSPKMPAMEILNLLINWLISTRKSAISLGCHHKNQESNYKKISTRKWYKQTSTSSMHSFRERYFNYCIQRILHLYIKLSGIQAHKMFPKHLIRRVS